jgi:hypothetical protein
MSLVFVATAGERKPLPPGVYPARLVDIEQREKDGREFLLWVFAVTHRGGEHKIFRPTSTSFGRGSFARQFAEALLGRELADGEEVAADELLGLECRLVLHTAPDSSGVTRNRLQAVLPADENESPF